ncbi:hypothetical protein [Chamaesiphon sp. OTE_75_metabat_556]|nr:hypothetical protein [Chamaesiphon sp. OTE_75_metabat_556]
MRNANRAKSITYGTLRERAILPLLYIYLRDCLWAIDRFVGVASVLRNRQ